jgi:hypothetical protein
LERKADIGKLLNFIGFLVLLFGLSSAVIVYEKAANAPTQVLGYEVGEDGSTYPVMPEDSKQYRRQLELYGGKENVLADEMRRWFIGLWEGKSLGLTIACISVLAALGLFLAAFVV